MKRTFPAFLLVLAFLMIVSAAAWAADGMTNAPAPLPQLSGGETELFPAESLPDAQKICDQVAQANNVPKCDARESQTPTEGQFAKMYYCACEAK